MNEWCGTKILKWIVIAASHLATEAHSTTQVAWKSSLETIPHTW
jgi:hypothetical protein